MPITKEDLLLCRSMNREIKQLADRIADLRTDARSAKGISYSDTPRGRGEPLSPQQRYIEQLEELSELYEEKMSELMRRKIAIERALTSLPPDLAMLMRYRYIDGLPWFKINSKMNISKDTSFRWHRKALEKLSTS